MARPNELLTAPMNLHQGPAATRRLPPVLPAGQLPGEQSNMWLFVPQAVQKGERFIQDDTREWFRDRDFKVEVKREYPDHPRWLVAGATSRRAVIANGNIISEIHMLVRLHAGIPEYPDWVGARMAIKTQQADLAYKLTKATRNAFLKHGTEAMESFATRAPAQFIKFVASTFVPKKIEVEQTDGSGLEPDERTMLLKALADELKRRQDEAYLAGTVGVLDYEPQQDLVEGVAQISAVMKQATGDGAMNTSVSTDGVVGTGATRGIKKAVNVIDHVAIEQDIYAAEGKGPGSVFSWED